MTKIEITFKDGPGGVTVGVEMTKAGSRDEVSVAMMFREITKKVFEKHPTIGVGKSPADATADHIRKSIKI